MNRIGPRAHHDREGDHQRRVAGDDRCDDADRPAGQPPIEKRVRNGGRATRFTASSHDPADVQTSGVSLAHTYSVRTTAPTASMPKSALA